MASCTPASPPAQGRGPNSERPMAVERVFDTSNRDGKFEGSLRPQTFEEFPGQTQLVSNLKIYIRAALERGEVLDHILLSGLPGLGKTTLAHLIARAMGAELTSTSGPVLEKPGDLAGILTNLNRGDVLFIDEIHRLSAVVEEYLYQAMEDFAIDILIDQGPRARSVKIDLPRFTLIGATTREGLLTSPFRARFGVLERVKLYPAKQLQQIVIRSAGLLGSPIDKDAALALAQRARGTPRVANRFLKRIRDFAQVEGKASIDRESVLTGLQMLGVDAAGLEDMDRSILRYLIQHRGGPIGLKTLSVAVGEEEDTIEDVYEPFLIQQGYLRKTPRGRCAEPLAYEHLGEKLKGGQQTLF